MPVLGAVLIMDAGGSSPRLDDERLTWGPPSGERVPVVVDTLTRREERELVERLENLPGVVRVDVAFHDFSDIHGECE